MQAIERGRGVDALERFLRENRVPMTDPMFRFRTIANLIVCSELHPTTDGIAAAVEALNLADIMGEPPEELFPPTEGNRRWALWVLSSWREVTP